MRLDTGLGFGKERGPSDPSGNVGEIVLCGLQQYGKVLLVGPGDVTGRHVIVILLVVPAVPLHAKPKPQIHIDHHHIGLGNESMVHFPEAVHPVGTGLEFSQQTLSQRNATLAGSTGTDAFVGHFTVRMERVLGPVHGQGEIEGRGKVAVPGGPGGIARTGASGGMDSPRLGHGFFLSGAVANRCHEIVVRRISQQQQALVSQTPQQA
mmetsp:Transcript_10244/g.28225  ORF Transcript_10244/g.28225 Transcript_10244/m.28225 type:complete len:208 (+) Transcript_10244:275-898(+)